MSYSVKLSLVVIGINILYTMATKTKISLAVPEIDEPLTVDVDLEEISVLGAIKGIPCEKLSKWTQQTQEGLYDWLKSNKDQITLTIEYNSDEWSTLALTPTVAKDINGKPISFGFEFQFFDLPYPNVQIYSNADKGLDSPSWGYFKEMTSEIFFLLDEKTKSKWDLFQTKLQEGKDFYIVRWNKEGSEDIMNAAITTPLTNREPHGSQFFVVTVNRTVELSNPKLEKNLTGEYKPKANEFVFKKNMTFLKDLKTAIANIDKFKFEYSKFPTKLSPSAIPRGYGQNTQIGNTIMLLVPLTIRRLDLLWSDNDVMVEGIVEPGAREISFRCDMDTGSELKQKIKVKDSTWHITLDAVHTKWIKNPKIKREAYNKGEKLYTMTVEFDYVV